MTELEIYSEVTPLELTKYPQVDEVMRALIRGLHDSVKEFLNG